MTAVIKYYEGIDSIAVIGNYLPRQCGIATFTTDLVEGLSAEAPEIFCWAAAMNDQPEGYPYPEKVRFEINQNKLADYGVASQFINISQTDIVCLQHEYGLFGGPAGSHLLKLLGDLRMPLVTTLHTVLKDPEPEYHSVMCKLSELSDKLVVMSRKALEFPTKISMQCPRRKLPLSITAFRIRRLLIQVSTKTSSEWKAKRCCLHSVCFPQTRASKMCCRRFRRL
jgi:hypothetical protein